MLFSDLVYFLIEESVQVVNGLQRQSCPAGCILFKERVSVEDLRLVAGNILPGVTDTGGGSHHDGYLIPLGEIEGLLDHLLGFTGRGGGENRHLGEMGKETAVLFCLGAVRAWIIGRDDNEAPLNTYVSGTGEGIRGHIQAHLLHGDCCPLSGIAMRQCYLESCLFIDGPLDVQGQFHLTRKGDHRGEDL